MSEKSYILVGFIFLLSWFLCIAPDRVFLRKLIHRGRNRFRKTFCFKFSVNEDAELSWKSLRKWSRILEVFKRHFWISCQKELPKLWRKHRRRLIHQIAKERMWSKVHLQDWRSRRYHLANLLKLSILHRHYAYGIIPIFYWLTIYNFHDF